jgi:hypothetical protein
VSTGDDQPTGSLADAALELYRMTGQDLDEVDQRTLAAMLAHDSDGQWLQPEFLNPSGDGSSLLEARALAGLLLLDEDIVWAIRGREVLKGRLRRLATLIEGSVELHAQVARVRFANGEEQIELRSGHRLRLKHAGHALRGLSVDCVLLDGYVSLREIEAHRMTAWPCMRSRPNPQLVINYGSVQGG